jgi:CubicO group peptidase (beta-lactamase class C family)
MKTPSTFIQSKRTLWLRVLLTAGGIVLISIGAVAWILTAGLREPAAVPAPEYWPTNGWRTSSPEEQGFDSAKLAEGLREIESKQIEIDSLLIIRNGYLVLEAHFDPYDGTFPHDLASVTKSVMTTLIAIAADQGKLDLDEPVMSFFPERTIANLDERKARMTVRHLAGMVNGMESGCYEGDQPTIDAMMAHPDYVQAALDRPMVSEPGTEYCYDSPGMHLLSAILQKTTGLTALDLARQNLFAPLGIQEAFWETDPQGYSHGWGDLHLLPEDAAKIGFLWLQRGMWDGQQIVPEAWVLDSVRAHSTDVGPDYGYGYGWWVSMGDYYASGRAGQKIRVMASINTVVVTTGAGFDYPEIESWLNPILIQLKLRDSRPANSQGLAALEAALAAAGQGSGVPTAGSSPDTAQSISGKTYRCEDNAVGLESLRVDFDDPKVATLDLELAEAVSVWSIGLDGSYRVSPEGDGMRGYWKDSQTFLVETFDIGVVNRQMEVDGDHLLLTLPDAGLKIACQVQNP